MKSCGCGSSCSCDDRPKNYMFFGNLQIIQRAIEEMMQLDPEMVDDLLEEHNWAIDHIATSADDIQEVANFFLNQSGYKGEYKETGMSSKSLNNSMSDVHSMIKSFESFVFEKKQHKTKKKKKDQDMDGDSDFADAKIAQYMAGGLTRQEAIKLSRKFDKK